MIRPVLIGAASALMTMLALTSHAQQTAATASNAAPVRSNEQLMASLSTSLTRFTQQGGETLYSTICQGCHMPNGQGANTGAGFFPDLRRNPRLVASDHPVSVVMNGLHGMQPFGSALDDQQIADVVNYVRTHFGNKYTDEVTAKSVADLRPPVK